MDTVQAEKVNSLAQSLYANRLAASMEEASEMAQTILGGSRKGEERSVKELVEEVPAVASMAREDASLTSAEGRKSPIKVSETTLSGKETRHYQEILNDAAEEDAKTRNASKGKIETLKRILTEEEERIASLKAELDKLKVEQSASSKGSHEAVQEIEDLTRDIDRSKEELEHIRGHVKDIEDVKTEIKDIIESQEQLDELEQKAQEVKENLSSTKTPPEPPIMPLDEWEDTRTEED